MILEYHRPQTMDEALNLLARSEPVTLPMGGGTVLNRPSPDPIAVVDLQALQLDEIEQKGNFLQVGATAPLQSLLETPGLPAGLRRAVGYEASYNLRHAATVAGTLLAASGRSPLTTALLAMDVILDCRSLAAGDEQVGLGDLLPVREERLRGRLVTRISLAFNARLAYEYVARSPADLPIVCAAVAQWPSGRTRLALGGFGPAPVLALDGPESAGIEEAARNAYSRAEDEWASAEYRQEMAVVLARRCLDQVLV
jgi:CO/xanthine dehydrogenase FAD-binding subunit